MKKRTPNTYLIIFAIICLCAVASWFVPGGEYETLADGSKAFSEVASIPQTWQVFSAFLSGFSKQAAIIVFVLIIGGTFWIINESKAIEVGIRSFLKGSGKLERNRVFRALGVNNIVMVLMMLMFSVFGAVFGMSEETIAFVAITVPLAISMGYDSITGVCMVYVAAHVGFSGAFLNPFTVGIAQNLSGLPLFSGIEYRFVCWCILTVIMMVFVLCYAARVGKNPQSSIMYEADNYWRNRLNDDSETVEYYRNRSSWVSFCLCLMAAVLFTIRFSGDCRISIGDNTYAVPWLLPVVTLAFAVSSVLSLRRSVHFYIMSLLIFSVLYLIIGVMGFQWYLEEISALFLALGTASGIAAGFNADKIVREFMSGAKDILSAALVIGLAAGIVIILQDGKIMDTILHGMEQSLGDEGRLGALGAMYGVQTLINLVIPSATAKAAITMPVMAPFSDLIGLSRQATVLAFQFGDGFTNMITPTSGVLLAVLSLARIPYATWVKWVWKFILTLIVVGFLLLIPTALLSIPGF